MKKFLIFLSLLFLALVSQFIIAGWSKGTVVDFFLILVIFWSYKRGWREGVVAGFFCGVIRDISFFPLVGANAFSLSLIGLLVSEVRERIYQQNIVFFVLISAACLATNSLILSLWFFILHHLTFANTFVSSLYPSLIYTCGLCGVLFLIQEKITRRS